jgi:hypothetical protein
MKTLLVKSPGSWNRKSSGAARTFAREAIVTLSFVVSGLVVYAQHATQFGKGVPLPEMTEGESPCTLVAVNALDSG